MDKPFRVVYENRDALPVRLEVAGPIQVGDHSYEHHRLVVGDGRPGAVVMARRAGQVLLVLSERLAAGRRMWELPRGGGDDGESPVQTGVRELREEVGLRAVNPRAAGQFVTDSAIFPQQVAVIVCDVAEETPAAGDGEIIDQRWVTMTEAEQLIVDGVVADALSLAAFALVSAKGL
ncbi:ADP-ribose pyrophosphatase [Microbacterium keratanolyticum]|uniref:Nudix hydrolase domain-containing protein n=1 Tax=Microbacterium keratanolyticum TaxID=67574 RepID=A0A9W6HV32_9MICO|nr:NUDIX hydrolase [Microbacterium keratanolyticum]MBM7467936.1 ADP-ribose pyrophosphatase [Microbacterium keratanolyticum]GLK02927.1 hypothetical protein GCM10017596_26420 [Microbacterium keratanolyticum]